MSKEPQSDIIPKLRFPKFKEAAAFKPMQLSELLVETKRRNIKMQYGKTDVLSVSGEHGCVNQIEFKGRSYAGASVKNYHLVETGDIVYTKSPLKKNPFGIIKENKGKPGIVSTLYAVYRTTDLCLPDYLDQYFTRDFHLNSYLEPLVNKGAKNDMKVKNADVLLGEIFVPKLAEQLKIADCLSSLDDLIRAEEKAILALEDHKKGLAQKLFPVAGKNAPSYRFPDFQNAPNWRDRKIGDCIEDFRERSITTDEFEVLTSSRSGLVRQKEYYYNSRLTERDNIGFNIVPPEHITYRSRSDDRRFFFNINKLGITGIVSVYYPVFCAKNGANKFLVELFSRYADHIGKYSVGNAQTVLSMKTLKKIKLPMPESKEQWKIADTFSSIDALIDVKKTKFEALKTKKRGLMQQLFASPETLSA